MEKVLLQENSLKESCSVCGNELTRYGSKALKDGILCRRCAKLCSGWLEKTDFAERSVEEIVEHLNYRRENQERVNDFKGNKVVDGKYSLFIDDENRTFLISKRADFIKDNADVFNIDDISKIRIIEKKYVRREGSDVCVQLFVNHPQFETLKFQVNEFSCLPTESDEYREAMNKAYEYVNALQDRR